jgi:type I restriction enzyme S subunit
MSTTAVEPRTLADLYQLDRQIVEPMSEEARRRPYLSLEHVESHTGVIDRCRLGGNGDAGTGATFAFDSRHVLYGKLRPYLNKVATPDFEGRCTTEIIPLLPRPGVDRGYLAWLLRSPGVVAAASRQTSGSRMPRADMDELGRVAVRVPSFAAQRRIAAQLTAAMAVVERARAAARDRLAAAKALPAAYLREAFGGIVPLWGESRAPTTQPPSGWRWVMLTDVARLESGHTPSRRRPEWWQGDIPWLSLADIRAVDGSTIGDTAEHTNHDGLANSSARLLPAGTVAMSRTASVGFVTIFERPMCTSQDFVCWVCGPELDNMFLMYLLLAARPYLRALAAGAIHKTIYMPTVEAFRVCLPSLSQQRHIVSRLRAKLARADALVFALTSELSHLDGMPAALLRSTFQGDA